MGGQPAGIYGDNRPPGQYTRDTKPNGRPIATLAPMTPGQEAVSQRESDELSRMIARLQTQLACLDFAAAHIRDLPGPVLEVGLGKARTYDRLRRLFPERPIFAFDKKVKCWPELSPESRYLYLGSFLDALPSAARDLGRVAALAHVDFGTRDEARDARLADSLAPLLHDLVRPGGLVLSDRAMASPTWSSIRLPRDAKGWPYFIYQVQSSDDGGEDV